MPAPPSPPSQYTDFFTRPSLTHYSPLQGFRWLPSSRADTALVLGQIQPSSRQDTALVIADKALDIADTALVL